MNLQQRAILGLGWSELLAENNPEQFVTLTFRHPYSDALCESAMRMFILMFLSRLPRRARRGVRGIVCAERTMASARFEGSLHFHILLWGLDSEMSDADFWLGEWLPRLALKLLSPKGEANRAAHIRSQLHLPDSNRTEWNARRQHRMCDASSVHIRRVVRTPETLNDYLTDDLYRSNRPAGCQILPIGPDGVMPGLLLNIN